MKFKAWLSKFSTPKKNLYYKISIIFSLFFIVPVAGFLYFAIKYKILNDKYLTYFFLIVLAVFFVGYRLLRKLVDYITAISTSITKTIEADITRKPLTAATDELGNIVQSFKILDNELKKKFIHLGKKTEELATLKELSDLCYMTFNSEDLLYITLEKALKLVDADIGSVMILTRPKRNSFIIEANIGLDDFGKKGNIISFEDSIAKYAVINKSPLLVEDIEKDKRFGRDSRYQYSTKSFICMPLKTSNDVIGALTISRKKSDKIFSQEDISVLTPLLSNAAFTYDNLRLLKEAEELRKTMMSIRRISMSINSSLKDRELLQTILQEMKENIPCDIITVLWLDINIPQQLSVVDFLAFIPTNIDRGNLYTFEGTILDKAIKQQQPLFIPDVTELENSEERKLFRQNGVQSCLVMPLKVEGRFTGFLLIYNIPEDQWERFIEIIETMGDHLSQAIEKDRMVESVIRRDRELESLQLIGSALSSSTFNIDRMLTYTMDMIQGVMSVEAGYILLLEEKKLKFAAAFNLDMEKLRKINLRRGEGISGYVSNCGMTVMANNVQKHPHFSNAFDRETGFNTQSILSVPLISQGRVIGVIELLNKKGGAFISEDKQLLQSIAASVSIALENAKLYDETVAMADKERGIRKLFQKFVPREVVDKIILGVDKERPILEEFKLLTLLNIDIRDFSPLSKKIGPKKTVDMLNYFFSIMGEIVFKHQGIVDKYLGDGFLAVFGAPVSSATDAENAIMAALEMQKTMENVNDYCQNKFEEKFFMGLGIHTGEVVVGNIGFEKKMDYTVIGDAVNFVFKLQTLCKEYPNEILISEATLQAAESSLKDAKVNICEIEPTFEKIKIYRIQKSQKSKK
ncbi:MAG: hypothetical protein A2031_08505 [Deltaproteobacteria bacterium RBG_19FT_COMBO_43_11]|nr:MAG: hypothetical protein A2031_08505 [Deltaproteobacteria bacterium RBG_19FT_COMBO_43_11]